MQLPAVTDIFKGVFDETLSKLLQPAGLVPSAVFVLLNLILIYPAILATGLAEDFAAMDALWQAVLLSAVVLVLGYVLLSLSSSTLRLWTGELWRNTLLGRLLAERQAGRHDQLRDKMHAALSRGDTFGYEQLATEQPRLPPRGRSAPTRLGNILGGAAYSVAKRYGFDLAAMWTHLLVSLDGAEDLKKQLDDERVALQTLANLALVSLIFAIEACVLFLVMEQPTVALLQLSWLLVAFGFYRASCVRAMGYSDLVEVAVDLHRGDVLTAFGLAPNGDAAERAAFDHLSKLVVYDLITEASADIQVPSNVTVTGIGELQASSVASNRDAVSLPPWANGRLTAVWAERHIISIVPSAMATVAPRGQVVLYAKGAWHLLLEPTAAIGRDAVPASVLHDHERGDIIGCDVSLGARPSTFLAVVVPSQAVVLTSLDDDATAAWRDPPDLGTKYLKFSMSRKPGVGPARDAIWNIAVSWSGTKPVVVVDSLELAVTAAGDAWQFAVALGMSDVEVDVELPEMAVYPDQ